MSHAERTSLPGDQARASVTVRVPVETAFRIFTEEIDQWWRRGPKYRVSGRNRGILHLEPGVGGRLFESFEIGSEAKVFETGRVKIWEPPTRVVFDWRNANFAPDEQTEVEVTFEPTPDGTLVTVTHRGWSRIRGDHPARHGHDVVRFLRMIGLWWGEQMSSMRERCAREGGEPGSLPPLA